MKHALYGLCETPQHNLKICMVRGITPFQNPTLAERVMKYSAHIVKKESTNMFIGEYINIFFSQSINY